MSIKSLVSITALAMSSLFARHQNFIIIYTDDLGYGDLGCYGAKGFDTPHLDQMAQEGMRFTDFSTSSSICSPSRAGLLTGRNAKRWGHNNKVYFPDSKDGMPQSEITIPEMLKPLGYTSALIGKWHLGHLPEFLPTSQGFDYYWGIPYSNDMWNDHTAKISAEVKWNEGCTEEDFRKPNGKKNKNLVPLMEGEEVVEWPVDQRLLTRRYTEKSQEFITANKDKPFFLYLAHTMPHVPLYVSEDFAGKTPKGIYGDVIAEIDWSVGQILDTLKKEGLEDDTLVVFSSDNGPWLGKGKASGSAGVLRAGKFTDYEGGCRVPCIAWQPGQVAAGVVSDTQLSTMDLFPTIAQMVGGEVPSDRVIDGVNITQVLKGASKDAPEREYYLYRGTSLRMGDWKLFQDRKGAALYNLKDDVRERHDVSKENPDLVAKLKQKQSEVFAEIKANLKKKK